MSIQPFLSATKVDLDPDCRPAAIEAVRIASGNEPITMETWDSSYDEAVEVCCKKIMGSSHYIGIFAYRRGWVPPRLEKSITEAEFDWAVEFAKEMVVFLPDPTAVFARELEMRAKGQSQVDADAQAAFIKRVMKKTYQPFSSANNLSLRIARKVWSWSNAGVRGVSRIGSLVPQQRPSEDEIYELGRKEQSRQFEDNLETINRPGNPKTACFLINGSKNCGHKQLIMRLLNELNANPLTKQYQVSLGPVWRQNTPAKLVQVLGLTIQPGWVPDSMESLVRCLENMLKKTDIILQIHGLTRFDGSLPVFVSDFWRRLAAGLSSSLPYRLIALATIEQTTLPEWEGYLQTLSTDAITFDSSCLIKLPELKAFTVLELTVWLLKGEWLRPSVVEELAESLIVETGGEPQLLYTKLADDETWTI